MNMNDLDDIHALLNRLGKQAAIQDFEEHIQLKSVRESIRTWREGHNLAAFAYVDDYANLWFEITPSFENRKLDSEIVDWGKQIQTQRNRESGEHGTLDATCEAKDITRIATLEQNGFVKQTVRSLQYERLLTSSFEQIRFPAGYTWRTVTPSDSVDDLVSLHRQAFGTDHMTVEYRQAMMRAPQYAMDLDLVALAPDGSLAGFCVCSVDESDSSLGHTDPIGIHPLHQRKGLAIALVSTGINMLQQCGVKRVQTGTSSENSAMQALAISLGFQLISEKIWFSLNLSP